MVHFMFVRWSHAFVPSFALTHLQRREIVKGNDVRRKQERTHCPAFMDNLNRQFGLVIAYLLPGFIALMGVSRVMPVVAGWLRADQSASLGAPLYALLAATAAGMIVSCFRWLLVDQLHALMGITAPHFNAQALQEHPTAFNYLVESHYRYYQFYANTLIAVTWTFAVQWTERSPSSPVSIGMLLGSFILCVTLFAGSRDALTKYRDRTRRLIGQVSLEDLEGDL